MARKKGPLTVPTAKAGTDYNIHGVSRDHLRMDLNTNLLGPNPAVTKVLKAKDFETHLYPSPDSEGLRKALGKEWKVDPKHVVCGNGVDDLIDITIRAFTKRGERITYPTPSFSMYKFFARANGCSAVEVPLDKDFRPDIDGLLKANARLVIVANPNNPTGNRFAVKDLERLIEETGGMVALDEAYIDYSGGSFMRRLRRHLNLIVFRTFSKAYGMAGMRVGVAVSVGGAHRLKRTRPPFNLNAVSEAAALAALRNRSWLKRSVETIRKQRPRLRKELKDLGFKVYPSVTNFLLCASSMGSNRLCKGLARKGVLIKDFGAVPRLKRHVRITVGARKHNDILLRRLREVLADG